MAHAIDVYDEMSYFTFDAGTLDCSIFACMLNYTLTSQRDEESNSVVTMVNGDALSNEGREVCRSEQALTRLLDSLVSGPANDVGPSGPPEDETTTLTNIAGTTSEGTNARKTTLRRTTPKCRSRPACNMPNSAQYASLLLDTATFRSGQPTIAGQCDCENEFTKKYFKPMNAADKVELTCGSNSQNVYLYVCDVNDQCRKFGDPAPRYLELSTACNGTGCTVTALPVAQEGLSQTWFKPLTNVASIGCRGETDVQKTSQCFGPVKAG